MSAVREKQRIVDVRTLFELNLALLRVRDYLFCGSPAIRQKWKEIRIRLALLFAILYQFEKRLTQQLTSLFMASIADEDMHRSIVERIQDAEVTARRTASVGISATIKTTDDTVGAWLDVLDNLIREVYTHAGYAYSYQQKPELTAQISVDDSLSPDQKSSLELTSSLDNIESVGYSI